MRTNYFISVILTMLMMFNIIGCNTAPLENQEETPIPLSSSDIEKAQDKIEEQKSKYARPLKVATKLSVVDAKQSAKDEDAASEDAKQSSNTRTARTMRQTVTPLRIGVVALSPEDLSADSDYHKDPQEVYVEDRSIEAFQQINEILCYLGQTQYHEMLNQGDYLAQVDKKRCEQGRDSVSNAGQQAQQSQQSGAESDMPEYESWTVNSSRADGDSPQVVKFWIQDEGNEYDGPSQIRAKIIISEGVSETNPYGIFTMNFKSYPVRDGGMVDTSEAIFKGLLKTERDEAGEIILKFIIDGGQPGEYSFTQKATLNRSADGLSGQGSLYTSEGYSGGPGNYNDDHPHESDEGEDEFYMVFREALDNGATPEEALEAVIQLVNEYAESEGIPSEELDGFIDMLRTVYNDALENGATPEEAFAAAGQAADESDFGDSEDDNATYVNDGPNDNGPYPSEGRMQSFNIAYDPDNFLREDSNGDLVCLDRNDYDESAWRYALYDEEGNRIERFSGFPIKYRDDMGNDIHGWIGYHGIWLPGDIKPNHGDQVTRANYGPEEIEEESYSVFISSGRLKKFTRVELTLGDIQNIPLNSYEDGVYYRIKYDGTNFNKVGIFGDGYIPEEIPPTPMDLSNMEWTELSLWSSALGGSIQIKLAPEACEQNSETNKFSCSVTPDAQVVFYREETVFPQDLGEELTFACFDQCLNPEANAEESPFYANTNWETGGETLNYQDTAPANAEYYTYTFDKERMILMINGKDVVHTQNSTGQYQDGSFQSGPLFAPTPENLEKLACEFEFSGEMTCAWQAYNKLEVFYKWETGPNSWNSLTAIQDANGEFVTFDPPLQVAYTHTGNGYENSTFYLEYNGYGDLHGVPGKCIDVNTGEDASCEDHKNVRWVHEFSISDGTIVTDAGNASRQYLVKSLEKEQRMKKKETTACSELSVQSYPLPHISEHEDPAIGEQPLVDNPPTVIGGVIQ